MIEVAGLCEIADGLSVRDILTVSDGVKRVGEKLAKDSAAAEDPERSLRRIHSLIDSAEKPLLHENSR
jgi:hypothetical protein